MSYLNAPARTSRTVIAAGTPVAIAGGATYDFVASLNGRALQGVGGSSVATRVISPRALESLYVAFGIPGASGVQARKLTITEYLEDGITAGSTRNMTLTNGTATSGEFYLGPVYCGIAALAGATLIIMPAPLAAFVRFQLDNGAAPASIIAWGR